MLIDNCIACQLVLQLQTGNLQNLVDNRSFYLYTFGLGDNRFSKCYGKIL